MHAKAAALAALLLSGLILLLVLLADASLDRIPVVDMRL